MSGLVAGLFEPLWSGLLNNAGVPNAGGQVFIYLAGTNTLATNIYTDGYGGVQSSNPVTLDANGRASIFGAGVYKLEITDSVGTTVSYPALDNYIVQPPSAVGLPSFAVSVVSSGGTVTLLNDSLSPGDGYVYGTDANGTKGWLLGYIVPAGTIQFYAGATPPLGYVACDGAAYSRTTYSSLFAAIGTVWGVGDGVTTFNVPDLRGRSLVCDGTGSNLTARTLADIGGEEIHTLTANEMPVHTHTASVTDSGHAHLVPTNSSGGANQAVGGVGAGAPYANIATTSNSTGVTVTNANTGGGANHNNMQPFAVLKFIIKT